MSDIIEFDSDKTKYHNYTEFLERCRSSREYKGVYCISIIIKGISYYCAVVIYKTFASISFLHTNECYIASRHLEYIPNPIDKVNTRVFLKIFLFMDGSLPSSSLTTKINIQPLPDPTSDRTLTSLETIIYIRCLFYRMLNIEKYNISDVAHASCDDDKDKINRYFLFVYRLFVPRKNGSFYGARELSIYYRFYRHIYNESSDKLDFDKLQEIIEILRKMDTLNATFTHFNSADKTCSEAITRLHTINDTISNPAFQYYQILYDFRYYCVYNKDCIYYPNDPKKNGGSRKNKRVQIVKKILRTTKNRTRNTRSRVSRNH
jgi:hypothetical protein